MSVYAVVRVVVVCVRFAKSKKNIRLVLVCVTKYTRAHVRTGGFPADHHHSRSR